jgi:uncharacterized protein YjbI with pentapeptide repeats
MANSKYLSLLTRSVADWNQWRTDHADIQPNLRGADLRGMHLPEANLLQANLRGADLRGADLRGANLFGANLIRANLGKAVLIRAHLGTANLGLANLTEADLRGANSREANFRGADLRGTNLYEANLIGGHLRRADLSGAYLQGANLGGADLRQASLSGADGRQLSLPGADLRGACLRRALLIEANLTGANLTGADLADANLERATLVNTTCNKAIFTGCRIHGISVWDLRLEEAQQTNLIITPSGEPDITVDNLEVAQFIYLLLNNQRVRQVIDTITSKVVLILGRFTPERKIVLDALRKELRHHNFTPVLFDFAIPADRDITETITLLARMARFIVADLTDPASIPMELQAIAPDVAVPIRSLVHKDQKPFSMFGTLKKYHWVLPPYRYKSMDELLANLQGEVIAPAEVKLRELKETRL